MYKFNIIERAAIIGILSNPKVRFPTLQLGHEASELKKALFLSEDEKVAINYVIKETEFGPREFYDVSKSAEIIKEVAIGEQLREKLINAFDVLNEEGFSMQDAEIISPIVAQLQEKTSEIAEDLTN